MHRRHWLHFGGSISRTSRDSKWKGKQCSMTHAWWRAWSSPRRRLRLPCRSLWLLATLPYPFLLEWADGAAGPPPVSILPTDAPTGGPLPNSRAPASPEWPAATCSFALALRFLSTAFQPANKIRNLQKIIDPREKKTVPVTCTSSGSPPFRWSFWPTR